MSSGRWRRRNSARLTRKERRDGWRTAVGRCGGACDDRARASTVFRFLTEPERFAQWMGGGATGQPVPGTTIDARPGGAMVVTYPGGARALGEVVEVDEPRRIVFTWGYEGGANGMPPGSCRVTITLEEITDGTIVTLRHEGISTEEVRKGHETGWRFYLSVLAAKGAAEQFAGGVESVCAAYFGAWNADDAGARRGALEDACDPGVVFRDGYGCVEGIERWMRTSPTRGITCRGSRFGQGVVRAYRTGGFGWRGRSRWAEGRR